MLNLVFFHSFSKEKKYEACTEILQGENSNIINGIGKAWCSTMVDGSRNYIPNEWGYCEYWNCPHEAMDKKCKTYSGPKNDNPCAFPFTFNGTEYNRCIITEVENHGVQLKILKM